MRYAVLINTNTSARQLKRIVEKLNNGQFDFYIHVDKKLNLKHYKQVLELANTFLVKQRADIKSGGFSTVKAILNGVKQILAADIDYDYITLLNGRDYPIKSAGEIAGFLKMNQGKQFIKYDTDWHKRHTDYTNKYHLIDSEVPGKPLIETFMNLFFSKPKLPKNLNIIGQSAYWTITADCAGYVIKYIDRFKFDRFLKYTKNPDLFVFQSIIMNSSFKDSVVNNNYRYTQKQDGSRNSKVLTINDFYNITTSGCLFASRFDIREDEKVLTMIDQANKTPYEINKPA